MLRSRMYLGEIHFGELHNLNAHEPIIKDRALFERVQRRTVSRGRQAKSERLLARLGVLRCGTCRVADGDEQLQRQLPLRRHEREPVPATAQRSRPTASRRWCWTRSGRTRPRPTRMDASRAGGRSARRTRRSNAPTRIDDTIRQLGELGLLGRPASQETLGKLTKALEDAHTVRARLGDGGESDVIGPDDIDKLREPAKRLAAWRRLITDTVEAVTVAPAMTTDGRPSRLWDPRRIDVRFLGPRP